MIGRGVSKFIGRFGTSTSSFEEQLAARGIKGLTQHGYDQMASRGFTQESVLNIIDNGEVKTILYRNEYQVHYLLGDYKIATPVIGGNAGKIITVMGDWNVTGLNGVKGPFLGF